MAENEILATATFSSVIHNNEICDEIVKWGAANGYPVKKAKLSNALEAYVGFTPEYMILAKRQPPIPGGWDITVEKYEPETRIIPVNVKIKTDEAGNKTYEMNKFIIKMMEEYRKEGLSIEVGEAFSEVYGSPVRDLRCTGHPILVDGFEEFIENMR